MSLRRLSILSILLISTSMWCCQKDNDFKTEDGDMPVLMLFCGAGIQMPVLELVEGFSRNNRCRIEADYAGSELLLSRITLKKAGDLYMPGDRSYVDMAADAGMIEYTVNACYFVPCILVQKGNPRNVQSLQDLIRDGIRLGLGDASACAIGRQSRKLFEKNEIAWEDIEKSLTFQSLTVNELGIQIQTGSLDAVIVWDAVANQYLDHGDIIEIPGDKNIISTVPIGVLEFSENKDLARSFVDFAASDRGKAIFRRHNYRVDPPPGMEF